MSNTLKWFHVVFFLVSILICLLIAFNYGWQGYTTITDRPGINGHLYLYYDITKTHFWIYNFFNASLSLGFIFLMASCIYRQDRRQLVQVYKYVLLFIAYIILAELFIQIRYVGKG